MEPPDGIRVGDLEIRQKEHFVGVLGREVILTVREFDILLRLSEHPGWAFSAGQLSCEAEEGEYSPESVSVLVSRIRRKLAAAGATDVIETVRGVGYRLHPSLSQHAEEPAAPDGADRELRDALWQLQEAVIDVERVGDEEREREVSTLLEQTRRAVDEALEE